MSIWFCGLQILIFNCVGVADIGFADYKSLYSTASDCKSDATEITATVASPTQRNTNHYIQLLLLVLRIANPYIQLRRIANPTQRNGKADATDATDATVAESVTTEGL